MSVIKYVSRYKMVDARFGYAEKATNTVYILITLPWAVKSAVLAHELYHLRDASTNCMWRELKANIWALYKEPWGQLWCVWLSLTTRERLKFYWKRFLDGR